MPARYAMKNELDETGQIATFSQKFKAKAAEEAQLSETEDLDGVIGRESKKLTDGKKAVRELKRAGSSRDELAGLSCFKKMRRKDDEKLPRFAEDVLGGGSIADFYERKVTSRNVYNKIVAEDIKRAEQQFSARKKSAPAGSKKIYSNANPMLRLTPQVELSSKRASVGPYETQPQRKTPGQQAAISLFRKGINTDMVEKEHASSRKLGSKFDLIKTVALLENAHRPGSSVHYDSLLKQR